MCVRIVLEHKRGSGRSTSTRALYRRARMGLNLAKAIAYSPLRLDIGGVRGVFLELET
jgi:hypothetical protein